MTKITKRYTDEELQEFKVVLLKKLDEAQQELNYAKEQIKQLNDKAERQKPGNFDDGAGSNEREDLNQMAARQVKFIHNLELALIRIENKTYGVCRKTQNLISKQRLMLVPHATLSVAAKQTR